jgi:hypothetical protein
MQRYFLGPGALRRMSETGTRLLAANGLIDYIVLLLLEGRQEKRPDTKKLPWLWRVCAAGTQPIQGPPALLESIPVEKTCDELYGDDMASAFTGTTIANCARWY